MISHVRKWLGYSIELRLSLGELLVIIALVALVNAVWPSAPIWFFFILGAGMTLIRLIARDLWRCLHRRGTA